ncbi:nucleoside/nucleotide kinase family protein [Nocardia otitidiscaviarum]|uniref:nucleoside/nucleotide kinase family protein n=1 Tax=Nocardia otitidiscaviarum TaxID=1823 RepID=UPI001894DA4F|nr:nucleoside/nucleotide kinase family protein [Nocardia otitidiscaviarum]MBF6236263.1 nucleoside/nucleotide kinase family protein [Nocardia otitidiscaviarum]
MARTGVETSLAELAVRVAASVDRRADRRFVLGIAGPPGAGKSTLARGVRDELNGYAASRIAEVAPMDGFHFSNARLRADGALARKGEPDTFDVEGYVNLLRTVRETPPGRAIAWPTYSRELHEPVPGGVVFDEQRIVVTEGNYLLLDTGAWAAVRPLLDQSWYLDVPRPIIEKRLVRRHIRGGRSAADAKLKVQHSDLANARLVERTRSTADLVLRKYGRGYRVD